jgi:hypothetical protein
MSKQQTQVIPFQVLAIEWSYIAGAELAPSVILHHDPRSGESAQLTLTQFPKRGWQCARIQIGKGMTIAERSAVQQDFVRLFGTLANPASELSTLRTALLESGHIGATNEWRGQYVALSFNTVAEAT